MGSEGVEKRFNAAMAPPDDFPGPIAPKPRLPSDPAIFRAKLQETDMKKLHIAILATIFAASPSLAQSEDWWLVSGEPGDNTAQFIDAKSVERDGTSVSFNATSYWSNGRSMGRELTMNCNTKPTAEAYADLWTFACGSEETRMSTALKLGPNEPEWMAKTLFSMPS